MKLHPEAIVCVHKIQYTCLKVKLEAGIDAIVATKYTSGDIVNNIHSTQTARLCCNHWLTTMKFTSHWSLCGELILVTKNRIMVFQLKQYCHTLASKYFPF